MYSRVYVEITDICNRNCSFCPGTKRPLRRMSVEEFETVTDKLQNITKYLYFHANNQDFSQSHKDYKYYLYRDSMYVP